MDELRRRPFFVFSGIANPAHLRKQFEAYGQTFRGFRAFGAVNAVHFDQSQGVDYNANLLLSNRWQTGIGEIGILVNANIANTNFLDSTREQAFAIPDIIRTATNLLPPDIEVVRIVDIVGLDTQADGGTHVASTAMVGRVEVVKMENKGRGFRRLRIRIV